MGKDFLKEVVFEIVFGKINIILMIVFIFLLEVRGEERERVI